MSAAHSAARADERFGLIFPLLAHSERGDFQANARRVAADDRVPRVPECPDKDAEWVHQRATPLFSYFPDGLGRTGSSGFHPKYLIQVRGAAVLSLPDEPHRSDQKANWFPLRNDEIEIHAALQPNR